MKDLTGGLGAHSVMEAVGAQESMTQAIRSRLRFGGDVLAYSASQVSPATVGGAPGRRLESKL